MEPKPKFKVWLETDERYVFGPGVYNLLKQIKETGKLSYAARNLEMSYRHAWGLIKKAEGTLGEPLLSTRKGGKAGGGGTELTKLGDMYLTHFEDLVSLISGFGEGIHLAHSMEYTHEATITGIEGDSATVSITIGDRKMETKLPAGEVKKLCLTKGDRVKLLIASYVKGIEKL
jgi:molybdate transport system regulatory protein